MRAVQQTFYEGLARGSVPGVYFILGDNGKYIEAKNAKGQSYYIRFKTLRQANNFIKKSQRVP